MKILHILKPLAGINESEQPSTFMPDPNIAIPDISDISQIEEVVKKVHAFNTKRWNDILERSRTANAGLSPKLDRNGRYHAPKDGYIDAETDRVFRGGAYLPFPEEYYMDNEGELKFRGGGSSSRNGWRYTEKIKMPLELARELEQSAKSLLGQDGGRYAGYFDVGTGKSWNDNNVAICYAYIKAAYKPILEAIASFARKNEHVKPTKDVILPPELGDGKRTVVGELISIKGYEGFYGMEYKMLVVLDDGNKVFGTIPSSLEAEKGDKIQFSANFFMKEPGFYYFKRPTKSKVVEKAAVATY